VVKIKLTHKKKNKCSRLNKYLLEFIFGVWLCCCFLCL